MKRAAENELDSSDDELFVYSNKQKLTFSSGIGLDDGDDVAAYSSLSDSSEEDEIVIVNNKTRNLESAKNDSLKNNKKCFVPPDILSPPPPPSTVAITKKGKGKKRSTRNSKMNQPADARIDPDTISLLKNKLDTSNSDSFIHHDDDDIFFFEEVLTMKLKVKVHGVVEKYEVKKTDPLRNVIADIAQKEDVEPDHVTLNWESKRMHIDPAETVNGLGLTIADIVECVIHKEALIDTENMISVKVQSAKQSNVYDVMLEEAVERVFKKFSEKCEIDINKIKFSFDGENIKDFKITFSKLDIMDGDVIDADV